MKSDNHLLNVLIQHKSETHQIFLSNTLKIPATNLQNQYGAISNFIVPRSMLDKKLAFFMVVRDLRVVSNNSMPNSICGHIDVVEDLLKTSFLYIFINLALRIMILFLIKQIGFMKA